MVENTTDAGAKVGRQMASVWSASLQESGAEPPGAQGKALGRGETPEASDISLIKHVFFYS
jgi:hypothetical protein